MQELRRGDPNRRADRYRGFDDAELERRWDAVDELLAASDLDALVIHGDRGFHQPFVRYLTDYAPPFLTYLVVVPGEEPTLFIGLSNHLQYVTEVTRMEDIRLSVHQPGSHLADRLEGSVDDGDRIGLVGLDPRYGAGMPYKHHQTLESRLDSELVDATAAVTRLVSVRSDAELARIRRAGEALDDAMTALAEGAEPGMNETELRSLVSEGAAHDGGGTGVVFLSTAQMEGADPGEPLPWKATPADRTLGDGDVITTEVSAHHEGYSTQIHRPFSVGSPSETYHDVFEVAEAAYENVVDAVVPGNGPADVHEALAPIEESPFKTYDVCLHGYGGGYLHPFVGTERSNYWPGAEDTLTRGWTFEPGQVLVVQPNVVTEDETVGLQFGTTLIVTENGNENVHEFPSEFSQV